MNYSDFWRINKSYTSYTELSNALRALRKVVGYMGSEAEVLWAGLPSSCENKIELPVHLVQGEYPIPAWKMDILVGMAIHETMHIVEDSQHAWGYLSQIFPRMEDKTVLARLAECGEDIHVDAAAIRKGLPGEYVKKSRAWWRKNLNRDFTIGTPSPDGLFGIWTDIVLDVILPTLDEQRLCEIRATLADADKMDIGQVVEAFCANEVSSMFEIHKMLVAMPSAYHEPLQMLLNKTVDIIYGNSEDRALCYFEFWRNLEKEFEEWKLIKTSGPSELWSEVEASAVEIGSSLEDIGYELPSDISNAIQHSLGQECEDVTRRIETALDALGGAAERHLVFPVVVEESTDNCRAAPHKELVRKVKDVFRMQQEQSMRINRGLWSGKLDGKRLYRAHTTGMIFRQKEYFPENNRWGITLLLDASGSVRWHWSFVESIYAALVEALSVGNNTLEVFSYQEWEQTCRITKLYYGSSLFTVLPAGSTPSGEAIIATAMLTPPGDKRLMIHITDGLWDTGIDTWYAQEFCREEGIDLMTLGCGGAAKALELQYGKNFELVECIEDLPRAIGALLRRKLLGTTQGQGAGASQCKVRVPVSRRGPDLA